MVDCSLKVPEHLCPYFEDFPPVFKNCEVGRDDIGDHMKEFAERHKLLSKPRKMLISSFKLDRGPIITPLLLFYLEKGVILGDVFWFLQYTPAAASSPLCKTLSTHAAKETKTKSQLTWLKPRS